MDLIEQYCPAPGAQRCPFFKVFGRYDPVLNPLCTVRARAMHTRPRTHTRARAAQLNEKGCGLRGA
jgi:hypothetical protein